MKQMTGKQSIAFEEPVYIASGASLVTSSTGIP